MDRIRHGPAADAAMLAAPRVVAVAPERRDERIGGVALSGAGGSVRADLDEVFRRDYRLVVGVAARVLGSRDEAEDDADRTHVADCPACLGELATARDDAALLSAALSGDSRRRRSCARTF